MSESANAGASRGPARDPGSRAPRRIVLLEGDERSEPVRVLAEFEGAQVSGRRVHVELQRLGAAHPGQVVAAEWLGPLGWVRFAWHQKAPPPAAEAP